MSGAGARLAGFAAVLAVAGGAAALAGAALDPAAPGRSDAAPEHGAMDAATGHASGAGDDAMGHAATAVRGLAVAEGGLRLAVADRELRPGTMTRLRFRILDADGGAVRAFDVTHTKRMHVVVARRDLTGFQHLHPTMAADGTWSVALRTAAPGSYRLFADFARGGTPHTLAADLRAAGPADLRPLPAPAATARTDAGLLVRRAGGSSPRAGTPARLRFTVTRAGAPVALQPYLGARGHLVVLREDDLGFLHVHPEGDAYEATFPTPGRYRLFLQIRAGRRVQTAAFTQVVR